MIYPHLTSTPKTGYRYGTGLYAVVQADEINREVIERTIERFREVGEKDWQSECPVSCELFLIITRSTARIPLFDEMRYFLLLSGRSGLLSTMMSIQILLIHIGFRNVRMIVPPPKVLPL